MALSVEFVNVFSALILCQTLGSVLENLPHTNTAELLISLVCLAVLVPVKEVNTRYRQRLRTPIPVEILTVSPFRENIQQPHFNLRREEDPILCRTTQGTCVHCDCVISPELGVYYYNEDSGTGCQLQSVRTDALVSLLHAQSKRFTLRFPAFISQVIIATGMTFAFSLDSVYNIEIVGHIPAG